MEQSTIKIQIGAATYYGAAIGDYVIALDDGSVLLKESFDGDSLVTVTEDTSGSVEVTEEMQLEASTINRAQAELARIKKLMANVPGVNFGTVEYEYSEDEI